MILTFKFKYKTLIHPEEFIYCWKIPDNNVLLNSKSPISPFIGLLLKIAICSKSLTGLLPTVFSSWFKFSFEFHFYDVRWANLGYFKIPYYQTNAYSRYSMLQMQYTFRITYKLSIKKWYLIYGLMKEISWIITLQYDQSNSQDNDFAILVTFDWYLSH